MSQNIWSHYYVCTKSYFSGENNILLYSRLLLYRSMYTQNADLLLVSYPKDSPTL